MSNSEYLDQIEQRAFTDPEYFWLLVTDPEAALREVGLVPDTPEWDEAMAVLDKTLGPDRGGAKSWLHGLRMIGAWRR